MDGAANRCSGDRQRRQRRCSALAAPLPRSLPAGMTGRSSLCWCCCATAQQQLSVSVHRRPHLLLRSIYQAVLHFITSCRSWRHSQRRSGPRGRPCWTPSLPPASHSQVKPCACCYRASSTVYLQSPPIVQCACLRSGSPMALFLTMLSDLSCRAAGRGWPAGGAVAAAAGGLPHGGL